jgi:hypothetical protein
MDHWGALSECGNEPSGSIKGEELARTVSNAELMVLHSYSKFSYSTFLYFFYK